MSVRRKAVLRILMGASALLSPQLASAKAHSSTREAQLEARIEKLEAEMMLLRTDLGAAREAQAQTASATHTAAAQATQVAQAAAASSADTATKLAALDKRPAPEGFRDGSATIKLGGFLKLEAANSRFSNGTVATNTLGRDFYLPQTIPTGGAASRVQDFSAKQARLWLNMETKIGSHTVKGYLETDFQTSAGTQGSQKTTNGYNLALRRAYVQLDRWTFGQDWTTFQYVAALPESTDFVGATEGTVFVRQPQIRYSAPLSKNLMLHLSAENPESGTATLGSPTLIENGTDRLPDFAARLVYAGKHGELSLAGLGRQVRVQNAAVAASKSGYGLSGAGKLYLNEAKSSDLRFMATYGRNIGRYVGLNFAPDAVYVPATNSLADVRVFAGFAALRMAVSPTVRVNLIGSYQKADYDSSLALAGIAAFNKRAWSGAVNLFYSPVKPVDLGIEFRHGERKLVSGVDGKLDRIELAAKYSF